MTECHRPTDEQLKALSRHCNPLRKVAGTGAPQLVGHMRLKHDLIARLGFFPLNRAAYRARLGESRHQRLLHSVSRRASSAFSASVKSALVCNSMMRCRVFTSGSFCSMGILYTSNYRRQA